MKTLVPLIAGAVCGGAVYVAASLDSADGWRALESPAFEPSSARGVTGNAGGVGLGSDTAADANPEVTNPLFDPEAALARLPLVSRAADRRAVALAVLAALDNTDESIERVAAALPEIERVAFRIDALGVRGETDAAGAIRGALKLATHAERRLAIARIAEAAAGADASIALAQTALIDDPELGVDYLARVASTWAEVDPDAALAWLEANVPANLPAAEAAAALDAIAANDARALLERVDRLSSTLRPIVERAAILALVGDDPSAAIAALANVGPGSNQRKLEEAVAETYAREDPTAALEWAKTRTDPRSFALAGAFRGAASVDFAGALDRFMTEAATNPALQADGSAQLIRSVFALLDSGAGDFATVADRLFAADSPALEPTLTTLVQQWMQADGAAVLEWALDGGFSKLDRLGDRALIRGLAGSSARAAPDRALAAIDGVPISLRGDWVEALAPGIARIDTDAALAFLEAHRGEPGYATAMSRVLEDLGRSDPATGAAIIADTFDGKLAFGSSSQFVTAWTARDPAAAAAWVSSLDDSESLLIGVLSVATAWSSADPEAALRWLLGLSNEAARDEGLSRYLIATAASGSLDTRALRALSDASREQAAIAALVAVGRRDPAAAQGLIEEHVSTAAGRREAERALSETAAGTPWTLGLDLPR